MKASLVGRKSSNTGDQSHTRDCVLKQVSLTMLLSGHRLAQSLSCLGPQVPFPPFLDVQRQYDLMVMSTDLGAKPSV